VSDRPIPEFIPLPHFARSPAEIKLPACRPTFLSKPKPEAPPPPADTAIPPAAADAMLAPPPPALTEKDRARLFAVGARAGMKYPQIKEFAKNRIDGLGSLNDLTHDQVNSLCAEMQKMISPVDVVTPQKQVGFSTVFAGMNKLNEQARAARHAATKAENERLERLAQEEREERARRAATPEPRSITTRWENLQDGSRRCVAADDPALIGRVIWPDGVPIKRGTVTNTEVKPALPWTRPRDTSLVIPAYDQTADLTEHDDPPPELKTYDAPEPDSKPAAAPISGIAKLRAQPAEDPPAAPPVRNDHPTDGVSNTPRAGWLKPNGIDRWTELDMIPF
jgi:hypothetical protein